jgi:hypothetical protein
MDLNFLNVGTVQTDFAMFLELFHVPFIIHGMFV